MRAFYDLVGCRVSWTGHVARAYDAGLGEEGREARARDPEISSGVVTSRVVTSGCIWDSNL